MKRTLQAAAIAALMLAPPVWLAHVMDTAQFKRAASDRVAWCAAHPEQEAGTEMCYLQRQAQDWCAPDWQELAGQFCGPQRP